jgi:hypothetical protein
MESNRAEISDSPTILIHSHRSVKYPRGWTLALPAPVGASVPYSKAPNPLADKRTAMASSYQMGLDTIPSKRTQRAKKRIAAIVKMKVVLRI